MFNRLAISNPKADLHPASRRADSVPDCKTHQNLKAIPDNVDPAVILVRERSVPRVIKECSDKGIKTAVVITGDFRQTGEEGAKLESEC